MASSRSGRRRLRRHAARRSDRRAGGAAADLARGDRASARRPSPTAWPRRPAPVRRHPRGGRRVRRRAGLARAARSRVTGRHPEGHLRYLIDLCGGARHGLDERRARSWRAASPTGGRTRGAGCSWPAGAALAVYILLDQGVSNGVDDGASRSARSSSARCSPSSMPMAIALMAMPALFIVERVGLGGSDLSVSDVALAAAFGTAVLLGKRPYSRPLRATALAQPLVPVRDAVHGHRQPLHSEHGRVVPRVAAHLRRARRRMGSGRARATRGCALTLIVGAACVIAVGTIVTASSSTLRGNFGAVYPAWPFGDAQELRRHGDGVRGGRRLRQSRLGRAGRGAGRGRCFWLLIVAILMTQSRQALIGLMVAIVWSSVAAAVHGRSRLVLLLLIPAVWLDRDDGDRPDRVAEPVQLRLPARRLVRARSTRTGGHSPIFGHGLRYWYNDPTVPYQPPAGRTRRWWPRPGCSA